MIASTQTNAPLSGDGRTIGRPTSPVKLATERLKAAGLRVTQPRLAILAALCQREHPASIEQIHADVGMAACDLVTVYRCMAAFEKIGLVTRAFFHNGTALFKLTFGEPERYHVVCKASNRVEELDPETCAEIRSAIKSVKEKLSARGYTEIASIVEFFGNAPAPARSPTPAMPAVS